ncbi:hypothetical protein CLCR_05122 [Cladophialophora carrionii]|uniref:Uncharacterized protein n=1 Tax=Cladophialophora carrionii TaxID=86049 RepID=A0A1C1CJF5_9EURO|nr:hypothetical protein CLCR_05122 [Cladophialophora carrionii]
MAVAPGQAAQTTVENTSTTPIDAQNPAKAEEGPAAVFLQKEAAQSFGDGAQRPTRWLTVSPYLEHEHLLDLYSVDIPNRLLALASTELEPASPHYATIKYEEALDWDSLMFTLKSLAAKEGYKWTRREFYVVEFRSKLKKDIDVDLLFKLDKQSHIEATASGGLLKYWYGVPDASRRNLATCGPLPILPSGFYADTPAGLWRSKEDAVNGGRGPWHKQARAAIPNMYEHIDVKGLRLVIEDDVRSWSFEPHA